MKPNLVDTGDKFVMVDHIKGCRPVKEGQGCTTTTSVSHSECTTGQFSSSVQLCRKTDMCAATTPSTKFEKKLSPEIGQQFLRSSLGNEVFLIRGVTMAF